MQSRSRRNTERKKENASAIKLVDYQNKCSKAKEKIEPPELSAFIFEQHFKVRSRR